MPPQVWLGTSTGADTGLSRTLRLEVRDSAGRLEGDYYVDSAHGTFVGEVQPGGALTAILTPAADCTFEFEGSITGDVLVGSFVPLDCPGGEAGTWSLQRQ